MMSLFIYALIGFGYANTKTSESVWTAISDMLFWPYAVGRFFANLEQNNIKLKTDISFRKVEP